MSKQFFPSLSQNYIEILEDDEYYDTTIEVEIFQIILKYIYGGDNFKESILSRVNDASYALFYHNRFGPTFGESDIDIRVLPENNSKEYDYCLCQQESYEKEIIDTEGVFSIEDYEIRSHDQKCDGFFRENIRKKHFPIIQNQDEINRTPAQTIKLPLNKIGVTSPIIGT
ncbi:BTB/POZ protein [Rhizophagus irregularis DAOM 181602=DAOM 197198]|nr:BTB/POZ protein [Rhizophagus irregularis DAOM 181602=DAOM 197198]